MPAFDLFVGGGSSPSFSASGALNAAASLVMMVVLGVELGGVAVVVNGAVELGGESVESARPVIFAFATVVGLGVVLLVVEVVVAVVVVVEVVVVEVVVRHWEAHCSLQSEQAHPSPSVREWLPPKLS